MNTMRRWFVVTVILIVVIAVFLGGISQIVLSVLPETQKQSTFPFLIAVGVTVLIANGVIAIMQWVQVSPLDFLPERSLKDILRKRDPNRFKMTKSTDIDFLSAQSKLSKDQEEYDWALVFAEAWIHQKPSDAKAYKILGEALNKLRQHQLAIEAGNKLTKLAPLEYKGFSIIGDAHSELGNWEEALEWYKKSLAVVDLRAKQYVLRDLVKTYEKLDFVDEAIETLDNLIPLLDTSSKKRYTEKLNHFKEIKENRKI